MSGLSESEAHKVDYKKERLLGNTAINLRQLADLYPGRSEDFLEVAIWCKAQADHIVAVWD